MSAILEYIKREPVVVLDVVKYVLAALVLFGLPIPPGLDALVAGALVAVLSIVTRGMVTPTPNLPAPPAE